MPECLALHWARLYSVRSAVCQAAAQRCCAAVRIRSVPSVPARCCCDTTFLHRRSADWYCAADFGLPFFLPCRAKQFRRDSALLCCCADGIPTENVRSAPAAYSARQRRPCWAAQFLRDDTARLALPFLPRTLHGSLVLPHDPVHVWCRAVRLFFAWSWAACHFRQTQLEGMRPPSFRRQSVQYPSAPRKFVRKQIPDWMQGQRCFAAQMRYDDSRSRKRVR